MTTTAPKSSTILPQLAADPLRTRGETESWLDWASALYAHTLAELALDEAAWAAHFGAAHPGAGYTKAMQGQRRRLAGEIDAAAEHNARRSEARKSLLHGIFTTALEGGIGYWSTAETYVWSKKPTVAAGTLPTTDDLEDDLDGFFAVIARDDEDEDESLIINADVIARGINKLADGTATNGGKPVLRDGHLSKLARALNGPDAGDVDFDAGDADAIVQVGLFGDVVYG